MTGNKGSKCNDKKNSEVSKPPEVTKLSEVRVNIPLDINYNILSRLPIESLARFEVVCHEWYRLIKDPTFIDLQLSRGVCQQPIILLARHQSSLPEVLNPFLLLNRKQHWVLKDLTIKNMWCVLEIVASCNGLLLTASFSLAPLCIYNPIIQESENLPNFPNFKVVCPKHCGFGYDPVSKNYKVVFSYSLDYGRSRKIKIITLGEDSWRDLDIPYEIQGPCVFLNGSFHWLCKQNISRMVHIIKLDISSEVVQIMKVCLSNNISSTTSLINFEESLALFVSENNFCQITKIIEEKNDVTILSHILPMGQISKRIYNDQLTFLGSLDGSRLLFKHSEWDRNRFHCLDYLSIYFLDKKEFVILKRFAYTETFDGIMFIPSLVSPSDICAGLPGKKNT